MTTKRTIDYNRPLQLRDGKPVEIIEIYTKPILHGGRHVVGLYMVEPNVWQVQTWYANGKRYLGGNVSPFDLFNVKDEIVRPISPAAHAKRGGDDPVKDMLAKIKEGEAIDLSKAPRQGEFYVVRDFDVAKDYCVVKRGLWIKSMGRSRADGVVLASTSIELGNSSEVEVLWIR